MAMTAVLMSRRAILLGAICIALLHESPGLAQVVPARDVPSEIPSPEAEARQK